MYEIFKNTPNLLLFSAVSLHFLFYLTEVTFKQCLILTAYLKISVNSMHLVK